ncbi:MBL fold metallo-hydrolase [Filobacillus milosensis]|uniref:MBL fold metallo-hydrolase n=1 Tax=Filobacillus milosensis TaxID=94137 RepID=A0A4Y8IH51_9BACI|nr:MBL fold metallo-hydrolase [Filobacillus milosensis]TFB15029.1 MBL fold metallo-hydrolase [Filobacillus milosensis]
MIQYDKNNITVFQSSLYITTTAIIHTDEVIIMTDPNWLPTEVQSIRNYIDKHLGNKKLYIIYTHSDFDHIIGSGAFPESKVISTEELKNNSHKDEAIKKIHKFDQGYYLDRGYDPIYPTVDISVSNDGESINLGDVTLTFYKAPGHTNDGLFTVIEPLGIFLSGDYLSDVEFPFIFSSYNDYLDTMKKADYILKNHNINYHIPGHGFITEDKQEMLNRLNFSQYYLENLMTDSEELEAYCRKKFNFFDGMQSIHFENKKIAKQEYS